eukprot:gnl/Spiro4/1073_TR555_c0_g1_i2.p3 gnl/Spiro4/1073_TR555_c0_g1~~gnl/Spiro4/1073_TR555_c0_g1_i2.p3  ORF type:complete len:102 (+),score=31.10 gnl/Spiro4/1073_TR555_c0_g1_i2:142-447(+)
MVARADANVLANVLAELRWLVLNWRYMVPFVVNQLGSLVYIRALALADLCVVVPAVNSLTLVFTVLTERLLGNDEPLTVARFGGVALLVSGLAICLSAPVS